MKSPILHAKTMTPAAVIPTPAVAVVIPAAKQLRAVTAVVRELELAAILEFAGNS